MRRMILTGLVVAAVVAFGMVQGAAAQGWIPVWRGSEEYRLYDADHKSQGNEVYGALDYDEANDEIDCSTDIAITGGLTVSQSIDVEGSVTIGALGDILIAHDAAQISANYGTNDNLVLNAKGTGDIYLNNGDGDDVIFRGGDGTADVTINSEGNVAAVSLTVGADDSTDDTIAMGGGVFHWDEALDAFEIDDNLYISTHLMFYGGEATIQANNGTNDNLVVRSKGTGNLMLNYGSGDDTLFYGGDTTGDAGIDELGNLQLDGDAAIDGGDLTIGGDNQPIVQSNTTFTVAPATMDADDGTGIKVDSITLNFNSFVIRAWVNITQGQGDVGDTVELIINDTDDGATPVTTLVAAQDCSNVAGSSLVFHGASSTTAQLAQTSTTNKYVVLVYKDVGNDNGAAVSLTGTLHVEFMKY